MTLACFDAVFQPLEAENTRSSYRLTAHIPLLTTLTLVQSVECVLPEASNIQTACLIYLNRYIFEKKPFIL